jgi:hypothetical protein
MTVRAKFFVSEKREVGHPNQPQNSEYIVLSPVTSGSAENESFYRYTPIGKIELGVMNPEAAAQFEVGKYYYIDFTKAE